jgi:hypothetical protein
MNLVNPFSEGDLHFTSYLSSLLLLLLPITFLQFSLSPLNWGSYRKLFGAIRLQELWEDSGKEKRRKWN